MGTTARWGTPYPDGGDTPAVHTDMQEMAESLDDVAKDLQGLLAARPAAAADNYGLYYWATDEELLYRSDGADWVHAVRSCRSV